MVSPTPPRWPRPTVSARAATRTSCGPEPTDPQADDEYNSVEKLAIWALTVAREAPHPHHLVVPLNQGDPSAGAYVRIHGVVQILDRSALRDNHGFVSEAIMASVETALREFLELT